MITKKVLDECLKEIDEYRLKQACKGDPRDYAIRVCEAILAKKAGYDDRTEWRHLQQEEEL